MSINNKMRDNTATLRLGKFVLLIGIFGLLIICLAIVYLFANGSSRQPSINFQFPIAAQRPNSTEILNPKGGPNIKIAYPSFIYLCVNGCRPHQNWIEFYLPSHGYREDSFRLQTSLYLGQILTFGIGSHHCDHQDEAGYTCIKMELSHRLLDIVTGLDLTPLSQLQNTNNWWLEYSQ